jgi:hypothetical protein
MNVPVFRFGTTSYAFLRYLSESRSMKTFLFTLFLLLFASGARANTTVIYFDSIDQPHQDIEMCYYDTLLLINNSGHSYLMFDDVPYDMTHFPDSSSSPWGNGWYWDFSSFADSTMEIFHQNYPHHLFTIHLTAAPETTYATICSGQSYLFGGIPRTDAGIYTIGNDCATMSVLNLTVLASYVHTDSVSVCEGTVYPFEGDNYNAPGTYEVALQNQLGCDSIRRLVLEFLPGPTVSVNQMGAITLQATSVPGGPIQWIDCTTGMVAGQGASFTPAQNGMYAAVATSQGCTDTSECFTISTLGIEETASALVKAYPVPATDHLILVTTLPAGTPFFLCDVTGKSILEGTTEGKETIVKIAPLAAGPYVLKVSDGFYVRVVRE